MGKIISEPGYVNIVNTGYKSTNYWVISAGSSRMLVDLGWPGTMGMMRANLDRMDIKIDEIRYCMATHYHMDHAGLAQELKSAGVSLLVLDGQIPAIKHMNFWASRRFDFKKITLHDNTTISFGESRSRLEMIGLTGEILYTPGHTDDSVSLLLDDGSIFTGDLTQPQLAVDENRRKVLSSWLLLREHGAKMVYPGHGPVYPLKSISEKLHL